MIKITCTMSSLEIQSKIKHKALEQQDALSDFIKWQASMHVKDEQLRTKSNEDTETYNSTNLTTFDNNDNFTELSDNLSIEEKENRERKKGNDFYTQKQYQDAIKCYTRCIALNPESELAYSNRGGFILKLSKCILS